MFIRYQESLKKQAEFIESKRKDYMYTKFTTQEEPKRAAGRIRGLIVEQHITDFLKQIILKIIKRQTILNSGRSLAIMISS